MKILTGIMYPTSNNVILYIFSYNVALFSTGFPLSINAWLDNPEAWKLISSTLVSTHEVPLGCVVISLQQILQRVRRFNICYS